MRRSATFVLWDEYGGGAEVTGQPEMPLDILVRMARKRNANKMDFEGALWAQAIQRTATGLKVVPVAPDEQVPESILADLEEHMPVVLFVQGVKFKFATGGVSAALHRRMCRAASTASTIEGITCQKDLEGIWAELRGDFNTWRLRTLEAVDRLQRASVR